MLYSKNTRFIVQKQPRNSSPEEYAAWTDDLRFVPFDNAVEANRVFSEVSKDFTNRPAGFFNYHYRVITRTVEESFYQAL
jgi:hypothetical protein